MFPLLFADVFFQGEPVDTTVARSSGYLILKGDYVAPRLFLNGKPIPLSKASPGSWVAQIAPKSDSYIEVMDGGKVVEEHFLQYRDFPTWTYRLNSEKNWLIVVCASKLFFAKSRKGSFSLYLPRGLAPFLFALTTDFPGFSFEKAKGLEFEVWSVLGGKHRVMDGSSAASLFLSSADYLAPYSTDLYEVDVLAGSPLLFVDLSGKGNFVFLPGREFKVAPGRSYAILKLYEDGYIGVSTVENLRAQVLKVISFSRYPKLSISGRGTFGELNLDFDIYNLVQLPVSVGKIKVFPLGKARFVHSYKWGIFEVLRIVSGNVFASSCSGSVYSYDVISATYFPPMSGFFLVRRGGGVIWGPSSPNRFARGRLFGFRKWTVRVGEVVVFSDDSNIYDVDGALIGFHSRGSRWKVNLKPGLYFVSTARGRRMFAVIR